MTSDTETSTISQDMVETETTFARAEIIPSAAHVEEPPPQTVSGQSHRPAWVEIDLAQLRRNFQIINRDKPSHVQLMSVLKDDAYGHGAY